MSDAAITCCKCHERIVRNRGNCDRCYQQHQKAIRRGETTWAQLEAQGLAKPKQPQEQKMPHWWRIRRLRLDDRETQSSTTPSTEEPCSF